MPNRPFVLAVALLALAGSAEAAKWKVAVLPFAGPQGAKAQAEVVRALRKQAEILPQATWDESAQKLFATSHRADDVAAVATDLGLDAVVTGSVKRDTGGWLLVVSVRHGPTGKTVEKLKYPLHGAKVDVGALRLLADDVPVALEKTVSGPPPGAEKEGAEGAASEAGGEKLEPSPGGEPPLIERPLWAPYIDASAAFQFTGRGFSFDQPCASMNTGLPCYRSTGTGGLRLDVTVYPLAFLARRQSGGMNAASGLALGATFDLPIWVEGSHPCVTDPTTGQCLPADTNAPRYGTHEYRIEGGLRWRWNLVGRLLSPEILTTAEIGQHSFWLDKVNGVDPGPPDVDYDYVTLGLGIRVPFATWIAIFGKFNFHVVFDTGSIHTLAQYGSGSAYGLRGNLGLEFRIWKALVARLSGFYEYFSLSFNGQPTAVKPGNGRTPPKSAGDQFYGGILSLGVVY